MYDIIHAKVKRESETRCGEHKNDVQFVTIPQNTVLVTRTKCDECWDTHEVITKYEQNNSLKADDSE